MFQTNAFQLDAFYIETRPGDIRALGTERRRVRTGNEDRGYTMAFEVRISRTAKEPRTEPMPAERRFFRIAA